MNIPNANNTTSPFIYRAFFTNARSIHSTQPSHRTLHRLQKNQNHRTTPPFASNQAISTTSKSKKRLTTAELRERIAELEEENRNLRSALAAIQANNPDALDIIRYGGQPDSDSDELLLGLDVATVSPEEDDDHENNAGGVSHRTILASSTTAASAAIFNENLENGIDWPSPTDPIPFWERSPRSSPLPVPSDSLSELIASSMEQELAALPPPTSPNGQPMHVVHITAEMAPVAKVGGLGDVVTGLSKAAISRGANVEIILPYYESLDVAVQNGAVHDLKFNFDFDCPKGTVKDGHMEVYTLKTQAWSAIIEGCPVILLRPDWDSTGSNLFRGRRIYGGSYNEAEAYLYFCRAAMEFVVRSGRRPDIIHAHEWQSAAVPMLFWELYSHALPSTRPVFTIHNFGSPGECRQDEFAATGVNGELYATVDRALDERTIGHNPERLSLLKGGIIFSSAVTTVSPNYATETITGGAAGWLQSTLARPDVSQKYFGVLNGIDTEMWNPSVDPLLPACFSADHPQGKALCKRYLQRGLGLEEDPDKPMVAVISRLVPQKGIHLIEHAARRTLDLGGQFVLLGTGHADGGLRGMADGHYKDDKNMKLMFMYSEALAHVMYAAADFFLVPSMYEPCGLTQLIALRYGAVPIVRATGGLADTVRDIDGHVQQQEYGDEHVVGGGLSPNGFVFYGTDAGSLDSALDRAFTMYTKEREAFDELSAMNLASGERWSWKAPAESYVALYRGVL